MHSLLYACYLLIILHHATLLCNLDIGKARSWYFLLRISHNQLRVPGLVGIVSTHCMKWPRSEDNGSAYHAPSLKMSLGRPELSRDRCQEWLKDPCADLERMSWYCGYVDDGFCCRIS